MRRHSENMLLISRTAPKKSAPHISAFQRLVSDMDCKNSASRKKKQTGYKQRCDKKRATYCKELSLKETEGKSAVYVDECGFLAESFRPYAYAPKGETVQGLISSQKHRATSMIAARIDGVFTAHSLFEGSCNGERFNTWLKEILCPHINAKHVVILDNARYHKTELTRELIEKTGAELLFLPPYSPDYNPIEHDFANIKRLHQYNSDKTLNEVINMYQ